MKLNYESLNSYAIAQAEGDPEEIAALVLALQERQEAKNVMDPEALLQSILELSRDERLRIEGAIIWAGMARDAQSSA